MSSSRVWLFRGLVVVTTGLLLLSWFMPWWSADIVRAYLDDAVVIHPYGLSLDIGMFSEYLDIKGPPMPAWFTPVMWVYLGICIAVLLFSLFASKKRVSFGKFRFSLPKVLIGGAGLSFMVVVILAVIVAAIRTGYFYGVHLLGTTYVSFDGEILATDIEARLRFGYWLACGVGPLLVVLALLRNRIIGKPTSINR